MRRNPLPALFGLFAACLLALPASAVKLPAVADEALTSAERLLGEKTGDDRLLACIDALPFLEIVHRHVPDYGYAVRLYGECLFLTDQWAPALELLEHYVSLVPEEARTGQVAEKVAEAEARIVHCRGKLGLPPPGQPAPVATATPSTTTPAVTAPSAPVTTPRPQQPVRPRVPARPAGPPLAKEVAMRGGYSPLLGVLGMGAEVRLGNVGLALGTGGYPVSAGVSFGREAGKGGLYVDAYALWTGSSPLFGVRRVNPGVAFGASVGYDLRPVKYLSIKAGLGLGYDTAQIGPVVSWDAAIGPVLPF